MPQETHSGIDELILLRVYIVNEGLEVNEAHTQIPSIRLNGELATRPSKLGSQAAGSASLEFGLCLMMLLCLRLINRRATYGSLRFRYRQRSDDVIDDPLALDLVNNGPSVKLCETGVLGDCCP